MVVLARRFACVGFAFGGVVLACCFASEGCSGTSVSLVRCFSVGWGGFVCLFAGVGFAFNRGAFPNPLISSKDYLSSCKTVGWECFFALSCDYDKTVL